MHKQVQPILFSPATRALIWGGTALLERWGKKADTPTVAECWELSSYPGSESTVTGGCFDGQKLSELVEKEPELFGGAVRGGDFPILVKLIDAAKDLSVQVHPDEAYARAHGAAHGKTEMWYVAEATPDAAIYYGFARDVSRKEVEESIRDNTVTSLLRRVPVRRGDTFFVPAGTVHALLGGVTVVEVQQNSDVTYRVYDYDRRDADGNPRQLHVAQALDVMHYTASVVAPPAPAAAPAPGVGVRPLADCPLFSVSETIIDGGRYAVTPEEGFVTFTITDGEGSFVGGEKILRGQTWMIPCRCCTEIEGKGLTLVVTRVKVN